MPVVTVKGGFERTFSIAIALPDTQALFSVTFRDMVVTYVQCPGCPVPQKKSNGKPTRVKE